MKRLYLTVEGQTEQAFCTQVLEPHLANHGVMVTKPRLTGLNSRHGGRIPKGGLLHTFQHALSDISRWLKEDKSDDARFSMMVDLYSLPGDFPGYDEAQQISNPIDKAAHLAEALEAKLNDNRFIAYLSVHEFEALVLSDLQRFEDYFTGCSKEIAKLIGECSKCESPEHVNEGRQSHPKARIQKYLPDYHENVDGPLLAKDIGLKVIREKCLHFNSWLTTLESLSQ